ncbi:MAG: alpha/beta hydrolase [Desulfitobacterium sp.]|nr:alpha/beta hydrolase [Desulfitobacterium sp.]
MPYIKIRERNIYYHHNPTPDGRTILFIHGAGGTGEKWVNQLSGIKDYHLIALDLPGHGLSEGVGSNSIEAYKEFIRQFVQGIGLESFVIAGHSMGGGIAMAFALDYPEILKGLIIVNSGARLKVNPMILERLARGEHPLETVKYSYSLNTSPEVLEGAIEEMKAVPTQILLTDFQACDKFNLMNGVQDIKLPTLVICGQEDRMTPVKYSEYLAQEIPQALLTLIPDAGHMSMLEQPEVVNKAIVNFIQTLA